MVGPGEIYDKLRDDQTVCIQVCKLPDADNICLILGGLVWTDSKQEEALRFKKTIVRYALLSWTMCLSQVSSPLRNDFLTDDKFIEKGLLTTEEASALKVRGL